MIGQVVDGKYEILRLVGEGGMGAVYEARHKTTGRLAALKVISSDDVTRNETLIARFEREAQAAAKVRSPHIVEILDAGHDATSGHPYMVMELLVGMNVHKLLKQLGPLPPELAVRIAIQTCFGLEKAHAVGVVHRDIKPANLFMSESDGGEHVVKLLDFGVAKFKMDQASESGADGLTRTGSVLGSPMFMSPEQARGLKTIDHRADIWSLGVVLYQLLSGKVPHSGIEGVGELIITICSEEPQPLSKRAPWISKRLEAVVHGALKLAPGDRYQSAAAMGEALATCLAEPHQWHIHKSMLVRLSDAQRTARPTEDVVQAPGDEDGATVALDAAPAVAAPPKSPSPAAPPPGPSAPGNNDVATVALEPDQVLGTSLPFAAAAGEPKAAHELEAAVPKREIPKFEPAVRRAEPQASTARSLTKGIVAVGIGVGLGVATVGFIVGQREREDASRHERAAAASASATSSAAAAVDPVASSAIHAASAPSAAPTDMHKLKIVPSLAGVTIDGKRAEKDADGFVVIDGAAGSSHTVIVTWKGAPTIKQVVLTDKGPVPHEIVLPYESVPSASPAATSAPAATQAPGAPAVSAKKIEF